VEIEGAGFGQLTGPGTEQPVRPIRSSTPARTPNRLSNCEPPRPHQGKKLTTCSAGRLKRFAQASFCEATTDRGSLLV